jgi:hypothetical protein
MTITNKEKNKLLMKKIKNEIWEISLLLPEIVKKYSDCLDDLTDDEFDLCLSVLLPVERYNFHIYEISLWLEFTKKRGFYQICSYIDRYNFSDDKNCLISKKRSLILWKKIKKGLF